MYCLSIVKIEDLSPNIIGRECLNNNNTNLNVYALILRVCVDCRELDGWIPHCIRPGEDGFGFEAV